MTGNQLWALLNVILGIFVAIIIFNDDKEVRQ